MDSLFLRISLHRMTDLYFPKLKEALQGLSQEHLWQEPYPGGNSIGGIALHVCEHIARNCVRLESKDPKLKPDFEKYFPISEQTADELLMKFGQQLQQWDAVISRYMDGERLLEEEHIHQIYHLVEHTGYHLGQIIDRVQQATGKKFNFVQKGLHEAYLRSKIG
ncbi:hypothetical protein PSTEL_25905 [Paenibacillus stellifer]|uniref:DinB-like domain-containing protein n=1 Tax=Paenibacillus stellifer TaxID=169760 RepID=A0A089M3G4_9BACL|nr:DinB family protein [Paenibacillus stellifer]AIQ66038.1 hypothetical protein PSTEL_25905 [Paenibacillus stellifer]